ncbi:hypothetical protein GO755_35995 [Spirosoma sp. HMF4905]|uniref:Uncharacterized protein n=1 Tax=Spirosoma arboris TaxID=2682092 RepID=A0A7K1SNV0_9BACT|nr:hypothetical protein [Spirosoma arboris]MVM35480.1 hypothetical protein [Spirosoma arboris]
MTELEEVYDRKFDTHNRRLDIIYLDALETLYGFEHQYLIDLQDNFIIIPPSTEFAERLAVLVESKRYSEIFGEALGGNLCIFEPYGIVELKLDNLHIFEFPTSDWLIAVSENQLALTKHIQSVRQELGPQFPDKIKGYTVVIADMKDPNGKKVELTTYDNIEGGNLENLFKLYAVWFSKHTQKLSPLFQEISDEVTDLLVNEYKIKPSKDGFINWFMLNKMKAGITIQATRNASELYDIEFGFDMLQATLTPAVIEQDVHDYCRWRKERHDRAQQLASFSINKNARQYLSKTPYSTFEELVDYFEWWTEKYCQSFLIKLQEVLIPYPEQHLTIFNNALKESVSIVSKIEANRKEYYPIISFDSNSRQVIIEKITGPISKALCYRPKKEVEQHFFWQLNLIGIGKVIRYIEEQIALLALSESSPKLPISTETDSPRLSVREKMLIHCYEQRRVINKGEPYYNDYIMYATPTKRKGYPNGSVPKAKQLIKSIKNILPHLSKKAAQQAESEINTLEANI